MFLFFISMNICLKGFSRVVFSFLSFSLLAFPKAVVGDGFGKEGGTV